LQPQCTTKKKKRDYDLHPKGDQPSLTDYVEYELLIIVNREIESAMGKNHYYN